MPHQDSPSPVRRPLMNDRTSSTQSVTQASPSGGLPSPTHRTSTHKLQHKAGHGRIAHARNPSYGRNLSKLTKLHGNEENGPPKRAKQHTPSTSPSAHDVRRNSSNVSLPRIGSKTSMKRNSSNPTLKRNGSSHTHLGKTGRPTTPLRSAHTHGKSSSNGNKANDSAKFTVGSEGHDDEWTEESASQSPSTTRQTSAHGLLYPRETPPPDETPIARARANLPDSPPDSPATGSSTEEHTESNHPRSNSHLPYRSARPPDANMVTSRLISRHASHNLPPQVSSVSVAGTPGTHTPPMYNLQGPTPALDPSMPENGVSRFLHAPGSSSGGSATTNTIAHLHTTLTNLQDTPSTDRTRNRTPSPNPAGPDPADAVRRAKSTSNIQSSFDATTRTSTDSGRQSPPSYVIDPRQHRRPGGNTAAKLELWRTQVNIESPQGPPSLAIRGVPGSLQPNMLGAEDRRVKLWEVAEGQLGYLRRFRNPVLEGVGRMLKASKSKSKGKAKSVDERSVNGKAKSVDERSVNGRSTRGVESRPPSAGRRSVRFEPGEGVGGSGSEVDGDEELEGLLRRMWVGEVAGGGDS